MQLESLAYTPKGGWSIQPFPALDSDRTLVIVFGAAGYARDTAPPRELRAAYPRARLVGRRTILGERTEDELEADLGRLPEGSHQAGFYSYGEIAPYSTGRPELHDQAMTLTMISEA
jgi:hypothetical protein